MTDLNSLAEEGDMGAIPGSREPSPDGLGPSGFDPARYEYRFSIRDGRERHDWIAHGEYGAVNIWAEPSSPGYGERWYGGIEGHAKAPAEYQNADKPSHDLCWLLLTPCWHDGSSLQFSEQVERGLPDPELRPMGGAVLERLKPILKSRYRSLIAEEAIVMEARSGETERLDPKGDSAGRKASPKSHTRAGGE